MGDLLKTRQDELRTKHVCRFCLTMNTDDLESIFSVENRKKLTPFSLQVMACASIEIQNNDVMPNYVCIKCQLTFEFCYQFKEMCKKSDTCLRHYPLTGIWSKPLERPMVPIELINKAEPKTECKTQIMLEESFRDDIEDEGKIEILDGATLSMLIEPSEHKIQQLSITNAVESDNETQKVKSESPQPKDKFVLTNKPIRILNKEAVSPIEPRMTRPVLKCDEDGNISLVTEILDPSVMIPAPDPKEVSTIVETNVFPCPHCERSFPLRQLLEIHMVNHNRQRCFACKDCNRSFFSKYDLQKHTLTHTGEKPYKCVVCDKAFTRSTLLHRHEKTHTDIPKFICVFCEKPFISAEEMEKHTERHRKHRPFLCRICHKSFAFKQGLERHEIVHFRVQPYKCEYCEQSFSTPSKLSRHLTAHAGDRPYPCKLCPKSYLLSHHLSRHMRSHKVSSGIYKCSDCEKTFNSRDDLIYHSAVHATQTLRCPLCKDSFKDIETVTEHVREHAEGEAFACEFCDLIFMTSERLEEHVENTHDEEMDAYNQDVATSNAKKNRNVNTNKSANNSTKDIDEVIEEFLVEEFADPTDKVVVKEEEVDWQPDIGIADNNQGEGTHEVAVETIDMANMSEVNNSMDEPPLKMSKNNNTAQATTKPDQEPILRRVAVRGPPTQVQKTEVKRVLRQTKLTENTKVEKPATPTSRNIQDTLRGLSKSVSIRKIKPITEVVNTSPAEIDKTPAEGSKTVVPLVVAKKPALKTVPVASSTTEIKLEPESEPKQMKLLNPGSAYSNKIVKSDQVTRAASGKIVEMKIGDKIVKVQKITMTKAQAAAMARDGRIQVKEGNMILTREASERAKQDASKRVK